MRKVASSKSEAGMLTNSINKRKKGFIASDQISNFRNSVNGTLTCCES